MARTRDGGIARKRFGQHFLVDRSVIAAIVEAIAPRAGDRLVEIGPGRGALTGPLLSAIAAVAARAGAVGAADTGAAAGSAGATGATGAAAVTGGTAAEPGDRPLLEVIEIDRDLAPRLARQFGGRLLIHQADALTVDFGAGPPLRLVGNLPYNISSPLLIHASRWAGHIIDQHFMLQREVVDRIVAAPGPDLGRLTVVLQNHYRVLSLFDVPPEAFDPPPRVQSSVIRMTPREQPLTKAVAQLEAVLGVAFGQRRKMLRATVGRWLAEHHPGVDLVTAHETDPRLLPFADVTLRPEAIPVEAWCALADRLAAGSGRASP